MHVTTLHTKCIHVYLLALSVLPKNTEALELQNSTVIFQSMPHNKSIIKQSQIPQWTQISHCCNCFDKHKNHKYERFLFQWPTIYGTHTIWTIREQFRKFHKNKSIFMSILWLIAYIHWIFSLRSHLWCQSTNFVRHVTESEIEITTNVHHVKW